MAFSAITARGSAVSGSNSLDTIMSPTANLTVGKIVFINCVTDNSATVDGPSDRHTVSDSQGNTWNKISEYTEGDGAADSGVCVSMWWSKITTQIGTADTITLTTAVTQSDKIITCFEATVGAGNTVAVQGVGVGQGSLNTALSGLPSREYLFIYLMGSEGEDAAKTPPVSYTEQFDLISSTAGALDANVQIEVATRIQTTTISGTVAATGVTGTNIMSLLAGMYETVDIPPPSSITGTTAGSSTATGDLIGKGSLVGTTDGSTTLTGDLQAQATNSPITGTTDGIGALTGTLTGKGQMTANSAGNTSLSGTLAGKGTMVATSTGTSTGSGDIQGKGFLAGLAAGLSTASGSLGADFGSSPISGAASGIATLVGTLFGKGSITGSVQGTSAASSEIKGKGSLEGVTAGTSAVDGEIKGRGTLTGSTDGIAFLFGRFTGTVVKRIATRLGIRIKNSF